MFTLLVVAWEQNIAYELLVRVINKLHDQNLLDHTHLDTFAQPYLRQIVGT